MKVRLTEDYVIPAGTVINDAVFCGGAIDGSTKSIAFKQIVITKHFKQIPTKEEYEAANRVVKDYESEQPPTIKLDVTFAGKTASEVAESIAKSMQRYNYSKGAK